LVTNEPTLSQASEPRRLWLVPISIAEIASNEKNGKEVVCLDEGVAGNDQLKANAVQIFKTKGVTSFKTV